MGRKDLHRGWVLTITFALAFAGAMAFPGAYAQTTGDVGSLIAVGLPLIVGLGVGAVYWAIITARRSRR